MMEHGEDEEGGYGEDEVELFEPDPNYEPTQEGIINIEIIYGNACYCFIARLMHLCICFSPKRGALIRRVPRHGVSRR